MPVPKGRKLSKYGYKKPIPNKKKENTFFLNSLTLNYIHNQLLPVRYKLREVSKLSNMDKKNYCGICKTPVKVEMVHQWENITYNLDSRGKFYKDDLKTLRKLIVRCPVCGLCRLPKHFSDSQSLISHINSPAYRALLMNDYYPQEVINYLCARYLYLKEKRYCHAALCSLRAAWICNSLNKKHLESELRMLAWEDYKRVFLWTKLKNKTFLTMADMTLIDLSRQTRHFKYCIYLCLRGLFTFKGKGIPYLLLYEIQSCLRGVTENRNILRVVYTKRFPFLWLKIKFIAWRYDMKKKKKTYRSNHFGKSKYKSSKK